MNNAPFRVGQRVVCVITHSRGLIVKDTEYTISGIQKGCGCVGGYIVSLVGISDNCISSSCYSCKKITINGLWYGVKHFAPIPPRSIEIPESLKEQAEEMKDLAETIAPMKKELV